MSAFRFLSTFDEILTTVRGHGGFSSMGAKSGSTASASNADPITVLAAVELPLLFHPPALVA
jgi:hypothetical protein